ncbi:MAG TPA: hypothetical protein PK264_14745 [Hyphomicrobiaceae bacterium]|nr:hypothetical protein [Hyphomicrobiaceae bacterium]
MTTNELIDALATRAKRLSEDRRREIAAALHEMLAEPYRLSADEIAVLEPALKEALAGDALTAADADELLTKPWS